MPRPTAGHRRVMIHYSEADLLDALRRYERALDLHRLALREGALPGRILEETRLRYLDSSLGACQRTFRRYREIAWWLAEKSETEASQGG